MRGYGPTLYGLREETNRSGQGRRQARCPRGRRGRHPTSRCVGSQHILWPICALHQHAVQGPSFASLDTSGSEHQGLSASLRQFKLPSR